VIPGRLASALVVLLGVPSLTSLASADREQEAMAARPARHSLNVKFHIRH